MFLLLSPAPSPCLELRSRRAEECVGPLLGRGSLLFPHAPCPIHLVSKVEERRCENKEARQESPSKYWEAVSFLSESLESDEREMASVSAWLSSKGIRPEYRLKTASSFLRKAERLGIPFTKVYDRAGVRGVLSSFPSLSHAAEEVEDSFVVLSKYDYVSRPKPNGYSSLHYVLLCRDGTRVELQLRTRSMHRDATCGKASHWKYKKQS